MSEGELAHITRVGTYGVVWEESRMFVVVQPKGPFVGRYDFPGGGIEVGEMPLEALEREFREEVGMSFECAKPLVNLSAVTKTKYTLFQVGLLYEVSGLMIMTSTLVPELEFSWVERDAFTKENTSALLWLYLSGYPRG